MVAADGTPRSGQRITPGQARTLHLQREFPRLADLDRIGKVHGDHHRGQVVVPVGAMTEDLQEQIELGRTRLSDNFHKSLIRRCCQ